MKLILRTIACLIPCVAAGAQPNDRPFVQQSFKSARSIAKREGKIVFVSFYTGWCAYCRQLNKTTYTDDRVIGWLSENTVPIKVNAEVQADLARRFRVSTYPTMIFAQPDGSEISRITGYVTTDVFLETARRVGELARLLPNKNSRDPRSRRDNAMALVAARRFPSALSELLWCYDQGASHDPSFAGAERSQVLTWITELSDHHPPARPAMILRRDAIRDEILRGRSGFFGVLDFSILNKHLGRADDTLAVYDQLRTSHPDWPTVSLLRRRVFDQLRSARRYEEIVRSEDIDRKVSAIFKRFANTSSRIPAAITGTERASLIAVQRRTAINEISAYYEVLLGAGESAEAKGLADRILETDASSETYLALASAGLRSGRPTPANLQHARQAKSLSQDESDVLRMTIQQLESRFGGNGQVESP